MNEAINKQEEMEVMKMERCDVMPMADVLDGEDAVTIWFEIPGASRESVNIEIKDRVLSMRAESNLRKGGRRITFHREFQLSDSIDIPKVTAATQDGVLTLTLPKSEQAKVHKIKVG
ncbi:MAG: Hsp20/alpha crystallin family protein [Lentisphaeria bacterium]|nr:Hsp20/alpha crystallin family protein [Lentisphaeria bacterium]